MAAVVDSGKLAENIVHFGRALRRAGIAIGPTEAAAWSGDIETAAAERRYLFAVTQFVVSGTVA